MVFRRRIAEVHLTTMEKDLEAYLEGEKPVYSVRRDLEDKDVLKDLHKGLADTMTLSKLDINAGVKYLWDQDLIDALRVAWKSPVSTKINKSIMYLPSPRRPALRVSLSSGAAPLRPPHTARATRRSGN